MTAMSIRDSALSVQEVLDRWPETLPVFFRFRMLCVGCAVARFHTIADACDLHGIDEEPVRAALDEALHQSALRTAQ